MTYVLDTDIATLAYHEKHGLRQRIVAERKTNDIAITLITRIEVISGRYASIQKAEDGAAVTRAQTALQSSEAFLADFSVLLFNAVALDAFDRFRMEKKGKKKRRNDLLIACICLANNATLVTRNIKDFTNVPGLRTENWAG